jgi:hypothetical protein
MPVADEGQDQDQARDHEQAGGLQSIDLRGAVVLRRGVLGRRCVRLSFWTRRRHGNIVALETTGLSKKRFGQGVATFREPPRPAPRIIV